MWHARHVIARLRPQHWLVRFTNREFKTLSKLLCLLERSGLSRLAQV
jgi:hypothetical protein